MNVPFQYFGETMALLTAIVWAFSVILFKKSGETVHPIALNLFKNTLAVILFLPTMLIFKETLFRPVPLSDYLLLLLSGFIGIGIGDTLFFKCLNLIGAGLYAIVDCMYSPFIITLSVLWLGESLTFLQILGVLLIISAVLTTAQVNKGGTIIRKSLLLGILYGILGTAAMAVGLVMIKPILVRSPLLWSTEIRLLGGLIGIILITFFHPLRRTIISSLFIKKGWGYTLAGSFTGAYLSMFVWLTGMKYANVSIASALNQTSNIFVFIFAAVILRERITWQRMVAIALAIVGVFLVLLN